MATEYRNEAGEGIGTKTGANRVELDVSSHRGQASPPSSKTLLKRSAQSTPAKLTMATALEKYEGFGDPRL
jgi:hypothetical protein